VRRLPETAESIFWPVEISTSTSPAFAGIVFIAMMAPSLPSILSCLCPPGSRVSPLRSVGSPSTSDCIGWDELSDIQR